MLFCTYYIFCQNCCLEYSFGNLHCSLCILHCTCVSAQSVVDVLVEVSRYMPYSHIDYLYHTVLIIVTKI